MKPDEVKNCMKCNASLERGYCYRYKDDVCVSVICFNCDSIEQLNTYKATKILSSRLVMDTNSKLFYTLEAKREPDRINLKDTAALEEFALRCEIQAAYNRIYDKIKEFETHVWFHGLQDQILATTCRGVSAKTAINLNVLTWTCAGRTMITIEDNDGNQVSMVADDTSKESRTGFQSVNCTAEQAIALIDKAIIMKNDGTLIFKDDEKVSYL